MSGSLMSPAKGAEPSTLDGQVEPRQRLAGQPVVDPGADRQMLGQLLARRRLGELGEAQPARPRR